MKLLLSLGLIFSLGFESVAPAQEIWFAPRFQKMLPYDGTTRPIDYTHLFRPGAPWAVTAAHVGVFKINAHSVKVASDAALTLLFQNLRERHIKVAMEFGMLTVPPVAGFRVEGFFPEPEIAQFTIDRIKAHGGSLDYIAMDEPYWYGSIYDGKNAVHWPAERIAANAAQTMRLFQAAFPKIELGDIEPVVDAPAPDLAARYASWIDAIEKAWGKPLAFFHADIVWEKPWHQAFAQIAPMIRDRHLALGIIYNQSSVDLSNDHWLAAAQEHYEDMENNGGLVPDQAVFQSWSAMPNRLLPEDAPYTHTHLLLLYLRDRVAFTAQRRNAIVTGTLADSTNRPIPRATVLLQASPPASISPDATADWITIQSAQTDASGNITMEIPPEEPVAAKLRLAFPGDAHYRAARTLF